jgi:hypothetical protein
MTFSNIPARQSAMAATMLADIELRAWRLAPLYPASL